MRLEVHDELDVIGPHAARVLRAHGLLWPCNVHFHVPLFELARGGALLTGIGGDELFSAAAAPSRRRRAFGWAPPALRRAVLARREPVDFEWLTPAARRAATAARAAEAASEPRGVHARMAWLRGLRYLELALGAIGAVAAEDDVELAHPLFDGGLWSTVAARGGFADRTAGMTALFAGVLPPDVLARGSKASFDAVFFNRHSREFARGWDGAGAPAGLVDAEALRAHWLRRRARRPDLHAPAGPMARARWPRAAARRPRPVTAQPCGRRSTRCASAAYSTSAAGRGGSIRTPRCGISAGSRAAPRSGSTATSSPHASDTQPRNGSSAGTGSSGTRQRSRTPTVPSGSPMPSRRADSARRSIERGPASAVSSSSTSASSHTTRWPCAASHASVVLLPGLLVAQQRPHAISRHEGAGVEALPTEPARGDQRHGRQVGMHERTVVDARREVVHGAAGVAVDADPAARQELQLRPLGAHAVTRRPGAASEATETASSGHVAGAGTSSERAPSRP